MHDEDILRSLEIGGASVRDVFQIIQIDFYVSVPLSFVVAVH